MAHTSAAPLLIRARSLGGFAALVDESGGDHRAMLRAEGLDPTILGTPDASMPLEALARVLERAASELKIDDFGLQLARHQDISVLGPVALTARHAKTMTDSLAAVAKHLPYHTPGARLTVEPDAKPGYTRMSYDLMLNTDWPRRHLVELSYAIAVQFIAMLVPDKSDWTVMLRHAEGLTPDRYVARLGCHVLLAQAADALIFPSSVLQAHIDQADPALAQMADRFVANVVHRFPLDIAAQVENLVLRQLATGGCSLPRIAAQLGLHERTLQRRLVSQGACFEDIVERARRARVDEYLSMTMMPLNQVAGLLGYGQQSSFNRACLRWFGAAPAEVRRRLVSGQAEPGNTD